MAEAEKPECTGKCQMVETYKSINRALTNQNTEFKETLAIKNKEISDLRQMVLELRTDFAEYKKSNPVNVKDTVDLVSVTTEAYASISEIVQRAGEKLDFINRKLLNAAENSGQLNNISPTRTFPHNKTPSNVSRIRPIIRTPNGLMNTGLSISLPRIDHSMMFSTIDRLANSTTLSEDLSSTSNVAATSDTVGETIENDLESPDLSRSAVGPSMTVRLPRHTSELPYLEEEEEAQGSQTRPNPEIIPTEAVENDSYYEGGLSVIEEVTEVEYTMNQRDTNAQDDSSSGGEEITSHRKSRSVRSNKENTLRRLQSTSISGAASSTPYNNSNRHERLSNMKVAQVVLKPLNMEEIRASQNVASSNRNDSEDSEGPSMVSTRKRGGRKRKEVSHNAAEDTDEEISNTHSGRPKRRATPTSFKEPALNNKLRRPE